MGEQAQVQTRFPQMKLPKPIIAIHNAVDEIEKAKKKRAQLKEEIEKQKGVLTVLLKRHAKKLGRIGKDGVIYKMNGYRVTLTANEKLDAKIESES